MGANLSGNCYLCGAKLGRRAMENHLFKVHQEEGVQECCFLKIEGAFSKEYWLYIDVPVEKTLSAVDSFLRKIWLECCGHMSRFCGTGYIEIGKNRKLGSFAAGNKFFHEYDFGSTTETVITVMGRIKRKPQREIVRLLARNAPPVFQCEDCTKTAEYISTECASQAEGPFYCPDCVKKYDDEMMLPVTNSPRMGVCGYEGEHDIFEFNPVFSAWKSAIPGRQK